MNQEMYALRKCGVLAWEQRGRLPLEFRIELPTLLVPMMGDVRLEAGKRTIKLNEGEMAFLRPGDAVAVHGGDKREPFVCWLAFDCYRLAEMDDEKLVYRNDRSSLPVSGWTTDKLPYRATLLLEELLRERKPHADPVQDQNRKNKLFQELVQLVLGSGPNPELNWESSIQAAIGYIEEHYKETITRSEIAKLAGFNTSYFSTLFTKRMGWGYSEYVNRVRVDRAKEHLLASDLTVHEIAVKVGYANGAYLSRKFKQLTGMSPGQFRNSPAPKRIAAFQFVGDLLAIGVTPVATDADLARCALLLRDELKDVVIVNGAYDDEQFDRLETDLVIAPTYFYHMPGRMKRLEMIAPVLALQWDKLDPLSELRFIGKLLHKEREAEQWIARYMELAAEAKIRLQGLIAREETAAVYEVRDDGIYVWDRTARGAFNIYDALNLRPPELVRKRVLEQGRHQWIDEAELPDYAADHMFIVLAQSGGYDKQWEALTADGVWKSLLEERDSRLYPLKLEEFWCSDGLALERQLEIQVEWLLSGESNKH
ncbi:helix-turn-helix domain-containing protein [Paenibacillaceae bacterium WGS1546]|uniref:helix-turn-helix domain-containing protein n=1 Tax=Cohnella sp. WGS1546 TaxID=3366810 RepID=UPI00372D84AC